MMSQKIIHRGLVGAVLFAVFSLTGAEVTLDINDDATALVVNVPAGLLTGCRLELAYDASTGAASKFAPFDRSLNRSDWTNATTLSESIPAEGAAFTVALADLGVAADACFRLFTTGAYTLLDYAWSNSENTWLDTGVKDTDVYALDVGFCPTARGSVSVDSTSYGYPSILVSIAGSSGGMSLWHAKTGLKVNFARMTDGKYTYNNVVDLKKDQMNTCVFRANSLKFNGVDSKIASGASAWVTSPVGLSGHTLSLNRSGDATTTDSRTKWYYVKFYDRFGDLMLDYVPAVKNNVVGFFDRASGNFVAATGVGALTAGTTTNAATAVTLPVGKIWSFPQLAKRPAEVSIDKTAGATLTVRVNAGYGQGTKLFLAHGTTDGGDDLAAWSDRLELAASVPAEGGTYTVDLVAQGLDEGRLFRVFAGDAYTPLARVQLDSNDDGIDTGIRDYNVYGFVLGYYCTGLMSKYATYFGSGTGGSTGNSGFRLYMAGSSYPDLKTTVAAQWSYENYTYKYTNNPLSDNACNDVKYSGHTLTLNGAEVIPQAGSAIWSSPLGTKGLDLYLGRLPDDSGNHTYGWWYYLTMEGKDGRKILDYLPVKTAAGTAGFFDCVSGRFITPTDGGVLVAGEEKAAAGYMGKSLSGTMTADDQLPFTATWKGGTSGDLNAAANWACTNFFGVELADALPRAGITAVTFGGPIAFNVTSAADRNWGLARFAGCTLADDCDWSAMDDFVIDGALDLAGNSLMMTDVPSSGEITSSGEDVSGEFHVTVAEGKTVDNTGCTLSGNLRFVKDGPGVFVATRNTQSYTAGTDILAGMLKRGGGGYTNDLGMRDTPVTVFTGAILDLRGCGDVLFFPVLAGGRLVNSTKDITNSWAQNAKVALEDDSSIDCAFSLGLIGSNYAPTRLDLGGYELDVVVANGKGFWLDNADVTAGLFKISGAGTFAIDKTSLRAAAADFDIAAKTTVAVPAEVHDWTVRPGAAVSGNGMISVNGTYHPMVADTAAKYTLKDGSKLNLSDCTLPLDAAKLTFTADATITVDFDRRKVKPDDQLVAWPTKPAASVTFKLVPGIVGRLGIKDDGLYFRSGIMIILR